jgi:hypothetical protein
VSGVRAATAAVLSVVTGVVVALLGTLATDRPGAAVLVGLAAATAAAALVAAWQSRTVAIAVSPTKGPAPDEARSAGHTQLAEGGRIDDSHIGVDPETGTTTRQETRDGGSGAGAGAGAGEHEPGRRTP